MKLIKNCKHYNNGKCERVKEGFTDRVLIDITCEKVCRKYQAVAQKNMEAKMKTILERIKDIIAQPPDRISHITIESYEKIRQAIFQAIDDFQKEG